MKRSNEIEVNVLRGFFLFIFLRILKEILEKYLILISGGFERMN